MTVVGITESESRNEIEATLYRYARGIDRKDWDLVRACYHPDAYDNHGAYQGEIDGLLDWLQRRHEAVTFSMHFISNVLIDFVDRETASTEAYCVTTQRITDPSSEALRMYSVGASDPSEVWESEVRCRFVDRFTIREGEWRIHRRVVVFETIQVAPVDADGTFDPDWATGRRDRDDPLYLAMG